MSAYWRRGLRSAVHVDVRPGVTAPLPPAPADSVVVGRYLNSVIVTMHGRFDLSTTGGLASTLHDLIDGQGNLSIVVDLRDVRHLGSVAVEALMSVADRIEARGGELRLGGPVGEVFDSLSRSGLARLIDVPFEQERRPRAPDRPGYRTARQAGMDSHPAGKARLREARRDSA